MILEVDHTIHVSGEVSVGRVDFIGTIHICQVGHTVNNSKFAVIGSSWAAYQSHFGLVCYRRHSRQVRQAVVARDGGVNVARHVLVT